jgi:UDP-N-acetylglucosamine/UDP-N-acetylgalactosamine 4-epimerase
MKNSNNFIEIKERPRKWLITGVAGFIGSNLLETLLKLNQVVVGLDNLMTGTIVNLNEVKSELTESQWDNFTFIKGDIRDFKICLEASKGVDYVLHHAALVSVDQSIKTPILTHDINVTGFLNLLISSRDNKVKRLIYASSSAVYGDTGTSKLNEEFEGVPISPYGFSKKTNENYAKFFLQSEGLETIGFRYFNVFGKRQNPNGGYAAVIPSWIQSFIKGNIIHINGDGGITRDFCFVENIVQANILASLIPKTPLTSQIYNISQGQKMSLIELYYSIKETVSFYTNLDTSVIEYREPRLGDIKHSHANIRKAQKFLNYNPIYRFKDGLDYTVKWYFNLK